MVLDVDGGTLAVHANGRCLGTAEVPLRPPLRWAIVVREGAEVSIDGPQPVPGDSVKKAESAMDELAAMLL